jgi:hypothetical protein
MKLGPSGIVKADRKQGYTSFNHALSVDGHISGQALLEAARLFAGIIGPVVIAVFNSSTRAATSGFRSKRLPLCIAPPSLYPHPT